MGYFTLKRKWVTVKTNLKWLCFIYLIPYRSVKRTFFFNILKADLLKLVILNFLYLKMIEKITCLIIFMHKICKMIFFQLV